MVTDGPVSVTVEVRFADDQKAFVRQAIERPLQP